MELILGLDISTKCIGLTLAKNDDGIISIIQVTYFKMPDKKNINHLEQLFYKSDYFTEILENYKDLSRFGVYDKITNVIIEEPLISSNNSITVGTLMRFNGMISQSAYRILGVVPEFISSYDARRYSFPDLISVRKYKKNGEIYPLKKILNSLKNNELVLFGGYDWNCDKKMILWNKISEIFSEIKWEYNKKGELKKENFDASDSLICIIGWVRKQLYSNTEKPKVLCYDMHSNDNFTYIQYKILVNGIKINKSIEIPK